MSIIDISKMDKAEVLSKLYNNAKPRGLGYFKFESKDQMNIEEAQKILDEGQTYFDYLKGRVLKISLKTDKLNTTLYDRDNGQGAAEKALKS